IALKETNQLIGTCGLFALSRINRKAELMIVIYNKEYWGKGFGTEAIQLLLNYGFKQLNLNRILLFSHDDNTRAQHIYEKIGFKPGGKRRQASYFEGAYHDLLLYDLLASEFQE
ncbi:MAG: GNAT family N-acetyltransferase, partial [Promethearchaeota archaeon]